MEKIKFIESFHIFFKIIHLISAKRLIYFIIQLCSLTIQKFIPVISLLVMQKILNIIQLETFELYTALKLVLIYISLDIIQILIQSFSNFYTTVFTMKFNLWIKDKVLHKISALSIKEYEDSEIYDTIQRAQYAENGTLISYCNAFLQVIAITLSSTSYLVILFSLEIWILPIILAFPIIKYLITLKINKERFEIVYNRTGNERKRWYLNFLLTTGNMLKEIKLNALSNYFISQYNSFTKDFNKEDLSVNNKALLQNTAFSIFEQLVDGGIFAYIIIEGICGNILIGSVVTYTRSIIQTKTCIQNILLQCAEIERYKLNILQILKLLDLEEEKLGVGIKINSIDSIEVKNLYYKYTNSNVYALKNISFSLQRGESLLIIGENGSGKTTLSKILLGLYLDYEGEILINGIELRRLDISSYRKICSALFQDFSKYEATLRENIAYGNLEYLQDCIGLSQLYDKFNLSKLNLSSNKKEALNQQLGNWFEHGRQLSIGQWQRLALSRAFAKKGDLYILDEPGASLDSISDSELTHIYHSMLQDKMGIIISHRLQTIHKYVSNIIILQEGSIIEYGTHESLMGSSMYTKLFGTL